MSAAALRDDAAPRARRARPAPAIEISPREFGRRLRLALVAEVGQRPDPVAAIAERMGGNRKTARNVWRGDNHPNVIHYAALCAGFPAVAAMHAGLTAAPDFARLAAWYAQDPDWWLPQYEAARQRALADLGRRGG